MSWPTAEQPFGPNHAPLLAGIASDGSKDGTGKFLAVPVAVDKATGAVLTEGGGGGGSGGTSASLYTGHATVGTSQVQVSASSNSLSNGIIVKAPSTNGANIYVGLTGVTTSTGDVLEPGEARGYAVNNTSLLYIISVASTTDIVTFSAN